MDESEALRLTSEVRPTGFDESLVAIAQDCETHLFAIKSHMLEHRVPLVSCGAYRESMLNLQDYLSLQKIHDLPQLQRMLAILGLAPLEQSYAHIMHTIDRQLMLLALLRHGDAHPLSEGVGYDEAYRLIRRRTAFLKPVSEVHHVAPSVMITLPSDTAHNEAIITNLAEGDISICRIDTTQDDVDIWHGMVDRIATLNRTSRRNNPIKVYVELAGLKFRTGPIRKVNHAFKISWRKVQSITVVPKSSGLETVRIKSDDRELPQKVVIVVPDTFYESLQNADTMVIEDREQRCRQCAILSYNPLMCRIEVKNVLMASHTRLLSLSQGNILDEATPVNIPLQDERIRLFQGDRLFISYGHVEGHGSGLTDYDGVIGCIGEDFLSFVCPHDRVYIDDGAIELRVIQKEEEGMVTEVIKAKSKGSILRSDKGIYFPDSDITTCAFTKEDSDILEEMLPFADMVGISSVQEPEDIEALNAYLHKRGRHDIGIIAKIETRNAVEHLPKILMALMPLEHSSVMLVRKNLALEVGVENLLRVQRTLCNLCEAAHIPMIYATEMVGHSMKTSLPSSFDIMDATIAQRADCIMLNKGPFAKETIETLHHILMRTVP